MLEVFLAEEKEEKKDIFESIWKFFASVKLAIFVLIALALLSIVGTIVEQGAEASKNITLLGKLFGESAAPTVYNVFAKMGFMDMYGSWWYVGLLVLFSINLIVCSIDRFPKTWRLINQPLRPLSEKAIKSRAVKKELTFKTDANKARDEFANSLRSLRYKVLEANEEGSVQLYTQKGRYARLAVYVVHLSIILIFLGAVIGLQYGFKGYLNLPEGQASNRAYKSPQEPIPLDFTIKCNWYETLYYEGGDTPKEFSSELVILEDGKEVLKKVIEVNDPLIYKGITFYQSSYGYMKEAQGQFSLTVKSKNGQEESLWLRLGDTFEIPGTGVTGTIIDFSPALSRDRYTGELTTYSETMVNPAVAIEFNVPGKDKFKGWILKRYPETGIFPDGNEIRFDDYWGVEYTGLQVAKDPGVWLIYLASIVMTLGLYICFFISHKKIWVNIVNDKKSVSIAVGGSTNRNRLAFEKEIDKLISHASEAIEGRSKNE
jgi:cytochrome c biogenesis protein